MAPRSDLLLALDTGSPLVSVALGRGGACLACRTLPQAGSSSGLIPEIQALLAQAGAAPRGLRGVLALAGPGSFTGLRVGCATALGLAQALGIPAAGVPTLAALARSVEGAAGRVVAAVDALRGEWFIQIFAGTVPEGEPRLVSLAELLELGGTLVGFNLPPEAGGRAPGALAPAALALAAESAFTWSDALLTHPLYLRAPAATPTARRPL